MGNHTPQMQRNDRWKRRAKSLYYYSYRILLILIKNKTRALYVVLSRAKTAGGHNEDPDFAFNAATLVNADHLQLKVQTPTTKARDLKVRRIYKLSNNTN